MLCGYIAAVLALGAEIASVAIIIRHGSGVFRVSAKGNPEVTRVAKHCKAAPVVE